MPAICACKALHSSGPRLHVAAEAAAIAPFDRRSTMPARCDVICGAAAVRDGLDNEDGGGTTAVLWSALPCLSGLSDLADSFSGSARWPCLSEIPLLNSCRDSCPSWFVSNLENKVLRSGDAGGLWPRAESSGACRGGTRGSGLMKLSSKRGPAGTEGKVYLSSKMVPPGCCKGGNGKLCKSLLDGKLPGAVGQLPAAMVSKAVNFSVISCCS
mmetsp:Transcript_12464/g.29369  ORF Transcript_12464/g.29369 Transcript_12464/m.29369 type:complete len:213 (-) Transcript_12464:126-764(-)